MEGMSVRGWEHAHVRMLLSVWLGYLGFDRFYNRQVGLGILKLITFGGLFIWWLVDAAYYCFKAGEALPEGKLRAHVLILLSLLYGYLGFDRFYNAQIAWGILKLLTFGGFLIWWLVDAIYYTYQAARTWER